MASFRQIVDAVCLQAAIAPAELRGRCGARETNVARQRTIMLARCLEPQRLTVTLIGRELGGRVSGSIVHAHQVAEARYRESAAERLLCLSLVRQLGFDHLPPYAWSARAHAGLDNLDRLIEATEARLVRLRQRRQFLMREAA